MLTGVMIEVDQLLCLTDAGKRGLDGLLDRSHERDDGAVM